MTKLKKVHTIIVHGGQAHLDDFLAVCIALVHTAMGCVVRRRNPSVEEQNNHNVLVMDVGGEHSPGRLCFDHHQLERSAPANCALAMLLAHLGLTRTFAYQNWVKVLTWMDSKGPFALSRELDLPRFPFELMSPVETAMIGMFEARTSLHPEDDGQLLAMMKQIGQKILDDAHMNERKVEAFADSMVTTVGGVPVMITESYDQTGLQDYRDAFAQDVAISVMFDDRGEGWKLYRFNDDPRVDFSRLEDDEQVLFAHAGGFIAKTHKRLPIEDVLALCAKAIVGGAS